MDKKVKAKWVKALRGGRYRQGAGKLYDDHGKYCCLGVLCRILGATRDKILGHSMPFSADIATGLRRPTQGNLANMNDKGKTFQEIADYIEKRL